MKIIHILILFSFLFIGCSQNKNTYSKGKEKASYNTNVSYPVTVDLVGALNNSDTTVKMSTFIEDISYIPIKTTADQLLDLMLIAGYDEKEKVFIIYDLYQVYVADLNGNLKQRIGRRGQGPGEYPQVSVVSFDPIEKCIYVLADYTRSLLKYSYNGNFLKKMFAASHDSLITSQVIYVNNNFVTTGAIYIPRFDTFKHRLYGFGLMDTIGGWIEVTPPQVAQLHKREREEYVQFMNGTYSRYKGYVMVRNFGLADTIFTVENNKIKPRFLLDYGNEKPDLRDLWRRENAIRLQTIHNSIFISGNAFETERYFLIKAGKKGENYIICHDKYKDRSFSIPDYELPGEAKATGRYTGLYNDIDGGMDLYPVAMSSDGNYWISYMDAFLAKEILTDEYIAKKTVTGSKEQQDKLKTLVKEMKEDDNPILVLMKVKQ